MSRRYLLVALPTTLILGLFGPLSDGGWTSACSCIGQDAEFKHFVLPNDTSGWASADLVSLSEQSVAAGFGAKIPPGSSLELIKKTAAFAEASCDEKSASLYQCDYWLQFNRSSVRGYSLLFHLSATQRLELIEAKAVTKSNKALQSNS